MNLVFHSYRDASQFAAHYCRDNNCEVMLQRKGNDWVIKVMTTSVQSEQKCRPIEVAEASESELLAKRENLFRLAKNGSLKPIQLSLIIDKSQSYGFTEDEVAQLRDIQNGGVRLQMAACRSCGMVGSNCSCGRSWF